MGGDLPSTYGYSELIHPSKFPIKTAQLHMGHIDDAANGLESMGTALVNNVTSAHEAWQGLPGCYQAPEATEFYELLDGPLDHAETFNNRMVSAAGFLRDWADVVGHERPHLTTLEEDAMTFYNEVVGGVETVEVTVVAAGFTVVESSRIVTKNWDEVQSSWDDNKALWERYMTIHTTLQEADTSAADGILALREVDERLPGQPGGPEPESTGAAPEMPWGEVVRGGQAEMIMGQVFLEQIGPLFGYNAFTGEFSGELAREAWTGLWNGIVDLATLTDTEVVNFVVEQWEARTSGGYVEYDPENRAHRVIGGMAEGLTIDLFSDDPLSQWSEDPKGAAATLQLLGIGVLASGPIGSVGSAALGPLARTLLRRGSVVVGNVRFWMNEGRLTLTNLLDGSSLTPRLSMFGPDGEAAMRNFLHLYEQEHGPFPTDRTPEVPTTPAVPQTFETQSGVHVGLGDHDAPPNLVSQSQAPARWTDADVQSAWENAYRSDGVRVDPRTGVPLVGGPPGSGPRQWVMFWDDANGQWVAGNRGAGWAGDLRRYPHDTFDPEVGSQYSSGDAHLPGEHPPGQVPPATTTPGSGETGMVHIARGESGMDYQMQISGYRLTNDGLVPEYQYVDPDTGATVRFDGHTLRGQPPAEVFMDAKDGYSVLQTAPHSPTAQGIARNLVLEADRQLDVLPDGATLEWHVSDPIGASGIRELLAREGIGPDDITVIYTPKP